MNLRDTDITGEPSMKGAVWSDQLVVNGKGEIEQTLNDNYLTAEGRALIGGSTDCNDPKVRPFCNFSFINQINNPSSWRRIEIN